MNVSRIKYLILGAGPTGLGAAYRLKELGETNFLVFERAQAVGGLAASHVDEKGFTWDIGGHVQFSHYDYFDAVMAKALGEEGWFKHQRESWVWMQNRFIPYPLQNNIRHLNADSLWRCVAGLTALQGSGAKRSRDNFEQWLLSTFGKGLSDVFLLPYNYKVWAYPSKDLACGWMGERVAVPELSHILKNILLKRDDLSWGPNSLFQFPKKGGTGGIWEKVADLVGRESIRFSSEVVQVKSEQKEVLLAGGERVAYDYLLSTIPLDTLCNHLLSVAPPLWKEAAEGLVHSTSHIVGIGLKGGPSDALKTKCWMYFPELNCPFYRVTVFSNYSPANVPEGGPYWSLLTETSESPKKKVDLKTLKEETIQGCLNTRLIKSREDIVSVWHHKAPHGYPTPSLMRDQALDVLLPGLDALDISSRGRFGAWKYEVSNQDHSMMQGVEWVNRLKLGIPETTVFFPEKANAPRPRV